MNAVLGLGVGFLLGVQHASESDHVAAVSTLLRVRGSTTHAARTGMLWGVGHSISVLALGSLLLLLDLRFSTQTQQALNGVVALFMVVLGVLRLRELRAPLHSEGTKTPLLTGILHGAGGSAAAALLAATTMRHRLAALAHLGAFCLGTIAGMAVLAMLFALPVQRLSDRSRAQKLFVVCTALYSLLLGLWLLRQVHIENA